MDIGTPLSSLSTKVMLLGAGELGKEVIISLQRLGVEVIAVDRYPNAPGHQVAHRAYVIDMTNEKQLREIIQKEAKTPIHTLMDWRQNVSKAINKTIDKLDAESIFINSRIQDLFEYEPWYETYATKKNFNGNVINIIANDKNANDVLTETGKQQKEKERMLEEAKELAKAELLREQEQAQKEKEATQKAEDVDIVIPFRNYGK